MGVEIIDFEHRPTKIDGLVAVTMKQVTDERGTVRELFRRSAFDAAGIDIAPFQQINVTESRQGAVRGMHAEEMSKLLTIATGEVAAAWIDLRPDSPTFGVVDRLTMTPGDQVLVPSGVGNGFQTLSQISQYVYGFDKEWQPNMAGRAVTPLDDAVGYDWPIEIDADDPAMISAKDRDAPTFAQLGDDR